MSNYAIIVGSVLGAAEYVADALAESIKQNQEAVEIHLSPDLPAISHDAIWIICTSTHGAGDLPDNIQPFAEQLENADLSAVSAYVIGLGDSSYDTFCHGAKTMETLLIQAGATLLAPPCHIDVLTYPIPEDEAVAWFTSQTSAQSA
ncbi:flavodoxin domain-containing protein [Alteromonas ponticola]|uniref:Flavodoxin domain-containing protein n=1 Tax=Alteromonas aquimaris TaxID=2998417 RepID=A0ABT3P813_9ALTE|nr:flavodoxin domain-containing protein [Alteromonas aquimaris]MCW8108875.1 flavodoxin domain-containing protein [Alteromonas aquimaris]